MTCNGIRTIAQCRTLRLFVNTRVYEGYKPTNRIDKATIQSNNALVEGSLTPINCWVNVVARNLSKKRELNRIRNAGAGRIKRRGEEGFNYIDTMERRKQVRHNDAPTIAEQFGWAPIIFMLVAPMVAWSAVYFTRPQSVRQEMLASVGMANKPAVDPATNKNEGKSGVN